MPLSMGKTIQKSHIYFSPMNWRLIAKRSPFYAFRQNNFLDLDTKNAALRVSGSVVSLCRSQARNRFPSAQEQSLKLKVPLESYSHLLIVVGHFFEEPYNLMAAAGDFSLDPCEDECKELFKATCQITRCGIGGPVVNRFGEVIGICFYEQQYTPVLQINIVSLWWEHYKKYGESRRPRLNMVLTNLYVANIGIL